MKVCVLVCMLGLLGACASAPAPATQPPAHDNLYATLYLQSAAEYRALSRAIYRAASSRLDDALADNRTSAAVEQQGGFSELPPGIIFDVDETVLDNSAYQATLVAENINYSTAHWDRWVADARARAVPGAVEFSSAAVDRGVTMLYLTNRRCIQRTPDGDVCPQRAETIRNLVQVGFPEPDPENVYLRSAEFEFARDKASRRAAFAKRYRILMLFGDDLGDFVAGIKNPDTTLADRDGAVTLYSDRWGHSWFMLPNPSYGSWLDVLGDKLYESLQPWQTEPVR